MSTMSRHGMPIDPNIQVESIRAVLDMSRPHDWYAQARQLRRKVHLHLGPTNSGKSHASIEALKKAKSGIFCAPLRLLASEVCDTVRASGVPCHLVTGQEVQEDPTGEALHVACTTETADLSAAVDVAVLDEIQLLSDPSRGWAWTRALLGLQAPELHLTGDPAAEELVRRLVAETGDDLEVHRHERLSPLSMERVPVGDLSRVQPGDCVVAFSRQAVHRAREQIEDRTGM